MELYVRIQAIPIDHEVLALTRPSPLRVDPRDLQQWHGPRGLNVDPLRRHRGGMRLH